MYRVVCLSRFYEKNLANQSVLLLSFAGLRQKLQVAGHDFRRFHAENGSIQYQQLSSNYLEETVKMMNNSFFTYENVSKAVGLPNDRDARAELEELTRVIAKDGVSVIAIDKDTKKVVGAILNKFQVRGEGSFFEKFEKSCKNPRSKHFLKFMIDFDNVCNPFDYCKCDCLLELMFAGILPEYRRKGIAIQLCEISVNIAQKLFDGENVKKSVDGETLSLEPVPQLIVGVCTTPIMQKIMRQLGFQIVIEKSYEDFEYEGKSYADLIGKESPTITLEFKKLNNKRHLHHL